MAQSRRSIGRVVLAVAAAALSGCGIGPADLASQIARRVRDVDGVSEVDLRSGRGADFGSYVAGTLTLDADDHAAGLETFDRALREAVMVLHEEGADDTVIGGITGVLHGGEEITPLELNPTFPTSDHRLDNIIASSLYERYGLG